MIWLVFSATAVLVGAGALWWVWLIPLPATLAIAACPTHIPAGCTIAIDGRPFGRILRATPITLVVQPYHPWNVRWR